VFPEQDPGPDPGHQLGTTGVGGGGGDVSIGGPYNGKPHGVENGDEHPGGSGDDQGVQLRTRLLAPLTP